MRPLVIWFARANPLAGNSVLMFRLRPSYLAVESELISVPVGLQTSVRARWLQFLRRSSRCKSDALHSTWLHLTVYVSAYVGLLTAARCDRVSVIVAHCRVGPMQHTFVG